MQSRRRRRDAIAHAAEDSWQHFQLYLHGCQVFAEDEATSTALQRHLVRTTAASLMDWLLHYQVSSLYLPCPLSGMESAIFTRKDELRIPETVSFVSCPSGHLQIIHNCWAAVCKAIRCHLLLGKSTQGCPPLH